MRPLALTYVKKCTPKVHFKSSRISKKLENEIFYHMNFKQRGEILSIFLRPI